MIYNWIYHIISYHTQYEYILSYHIASLNLLIGFETLIYGRKWIHTTCHRSSDLSHMDTRKYHPTRFHVPLDAILELYRRLVNCFMHGFQPFPYNNQSICIYGNAVFMLCFGSKILWVLHFFTTMIPWLDPVSVVVGQNIFNGPKKKLIIMICFQYDVFNQIF